MASALLLLAVLAGCYGGFALLALAQLRHFKRVLADERASLHHAAARRGAACALLALALVLAWLRDGAAFGSVLWLLMLTLAATAVAFTLSWRAHWLRPLAVR